MPNPFPDLPPGFLCSAPGTGVYLLDNYGNPYNRRIQRKVRAAMDKDARAIDRAVTAAPAIAANRERRRHRGHWVNPAGWFATALLPNETACQEAIEKFYADISNPGNLTEVPELLAEGFTYKAPAATGLLPACVADIGGWAAAGAEDWTAAMERQMDAFNGSLSTLEGNVTCRPEATADILEPLLMCVARHKCRYTLKKVQSAAGGNQELEGESMDRFWFNSKTLIVKYQSAADPAYFRYANTSLTEEGEEGGDADAA